MTEDAGERFAGWRSRRPRRRWSRRCGRRAGSAARRSTLHSVPFSHRSGERIEPLISLQWFCRMDELAAPAIEVVERDEVRIVPDAVEARLPRVDAQHPAVVRLAPALVGTPAAGLVLRRVRRDRRRRVAARALPRRPRRAAPGRGRPRHLVLVGAVAVRDARLARGHAGAARLLPDRLPHDGAGDHLPLGRPHGDDGDRVHGRDPVSTTSTCTR